MRYFHVIIVRLILMLFLVPVAYISSRKSVKVRCLSVDNLSDGTTFGLDKVRRHVLLIMVGLDDKT